MRKFIYFMKRRFCPVMFALLIVFFSVMIPVSRVEASPAPVLPPTFEVIPGGAASGITYYDVASSIFGAAGIDIKMVDEDGQPKSFEKELWDEMCDLFDIWAKDNFGTSDFDEIDAEISGLITDAVDGVIHISKKLFEALQKWGNEAADWVKAHTVDESQLTDGKYITFEYLDSLMQGSWSKYYTNYPGYNSLETYKKNYNASKNTHFILCHDIIYGYDVYYFMSSTYPYYYFCSCPKMNTYNTYVAYHDSGYGYSLVSLGKIGAGGSYVDQSLQFPLSHSSHIVATNMTLISDPHISDGLISPVHPNYPIEHVVFTPQPVPVTWPDYVASVVPDADPDSLPDSAPVPVPHRNPVTGEIIEPNPDPEPDPDPEPGTDPDPAENVDPDQIAGLPDKITAAGDITKLFPFCIPFDIIALVKTMKAEKAPPVWHFEYYFKQIDYKFEVTVDMSQYEVYVKIFRSGFVILYIITLMLLTIRYSSGIAKD